MMNLKEVREQLRDQGITNSEEVVIRWILEGRLKAKRTNNFKMDYIIKPSDLAAFILEKLIENKSKQYGVDFHHWEKTFNENKTLKEENEELKSIVRIEQSKVRSLKRMLQAEYALSNTPPLSYTALLGLEVDADKETIKKEFKKLIKALHPDRGGDEQLFKVFYDHYRKIK
jgi:hypothetical protein